MKSQTDFKYSAEWHHGKGALQRAIEAMVSHNYEFICARDEACSPAKCFATYQTVNHFIEAFKHIPEKERSFHEVLYDKDTDIFKLTADLDYEYDQYDECDLMNDFEAIFEATLEKLGIEFQQEHVKWLSACDEGTNKGSLHFIYNAEVGTRGWTIQKAFWFEARRIARENDKLLVVKDGKCECLIDFGLYNKNHCLRMPLCVKPAEANNPNRYLSPLDDIKWSEYSDYVVKFNHVPERVISLDTINPIEERADSCDDIPRPFVENIILSRVPNVVISGYSNNLYKLSNVGTRTCIISGAVHTSNNCYAYVDKKGIWFKCHSDKCAGKKLLHAHTSRNLTLSVEEMLELQKFTNAQIDKATAHFGDDYSALNEAINLIVAEAKNIMVELINNEYALIKNGTSAVVFRTTTKDDGRVITKLDSLRTMEVAFANRSLKYPEYNEKGNMKYKTVRAYKTWLESINRRDYTEVVFCPEIDNKKFDHSTIAGKFNIYNGFAIRKDSNWHGSVENNPFIKHITDVWCCGDLVVAKWVLQYFAHILQKPWELPGSAIVLKSKEGAGKGIIMEKLRAILGDSLFASPPQDALDGNFNGQLEGNLINYFNECTWGGNKRSDGKLKKIITEHKMDINIKNIPSYTVDNCSRNIFDSNNDWVVSVGENARRFCCLEPLDKYVGKTRATSPELAEIIDMSPYEVAQILYRYDIGGFNPRAPPKTEALRDQKLESMSPFQEFWDEFLRGDDYVGGQIAKSIIYDKYKATTRYPQNNVSFWKKTRQLLGLTNADFKQRHGKREVVLPERAEAKLKFCSYYRDENWFGNDNIEIIEDTEDENSADYLHSI